MCTCVMPSHSMVALLNPISDLAPQERESRVAQNKDLVADAQTLLEENLSERNQ